MWKLESVTLPVMSVDETEHRDTLTPYWIGNHHAESSIAKDITMCKGLRSRNVQAMELAIHLQI